MWQWRHGKQCYKDNMHIQGDLVKVDIQSCFQAKTGSVRTCVVTWSAAYAMCPALRSKLICTASLIVNHAWWHELSVVVCGLS